MTTDLKTRSKKFALDIIRLYPALPRRAEAQVIGRQILRSGTSVGAHYHEAQRAKSNADFISKIEGGLQELEETGYWLDLLNEAGFVPVEAFNRLKQETNELIRIFVSIVRKTRSRGKTQRL